jgi:hypothetical protein
VSTTQQEAAAARRAPVEVVERASVVSLRRLRDGARVWSLAMRVRPDSEAAMRRAVALVAELDAELEQHYPATGEDAEAVS